MSYYYEELLTKAYDAAEDAVRLADSYGDKGPCGFAWVNVSPVRGKFVKFCRESRDAMAELEPRESMRYGDKGYSGGWEFWCPGIRVTPRYRGVHLVEAGAHAFAAVLRGNGINCVVGSRLD